MYFVGEVHQSWKKWTNSKKFFKSYRVNKCLRPVALAATAAHEPVQKHKVIPSILGWLNNWLQRNTLLCVITLPWDGWSAIFNLRLLRFNLADCFLIVPQFRVLLNNPGSLKNVTHQKKQWQEPEWWIYRWMKSLHLLGTTCSFVDYCDWRLRSWSITCAM